MNPRRLRTFKALNKMTTMTTEEIIFFKSIVTILKSFTYDAAGKEKYKFQNEIDKLERLIWLHE